MKTVPFGILPRASAGFSLLELLVVISIMALVAGLVIPAMTSVLESNNITQAGQVVANEIGLARQIASARNCSVQVWLIKRTVVSPSGFSAVQLWTNASGTSSMRPASRLAPLPQGIVISQDSSAMSPLLASAPATNTVPSGYSTGGSAYSSFQIGASGQVTPSLAMGSLYLTLVPNRYATATAAPRNFATVQINPNTGAVSVYRP
jgi:uncharacterized protein (TIGR02596 family)